MRLLDRDAGGYVKRTTTAIALVAFIALVSACASGRPRGPSNQVIERVLAQAPGAAQPSTIVSTEIAFARAAREQGQWTAFRAFAAPGALVHGGGGPVDVASFLVGRSDPAQAVQWAPRVIAMSCDGELAVSQGRFRDPAGIVGSFVTVWQRQRDNSYRYLYDVGGADVPQPPPRSEVEDGNIVVTAIDAVQGLIATCPRGGETVPPPPAVPIGEEGAAGAQLSRDGTLRWRWEHRPDGTRHVIAEYYYLGAWVTAIEENLASGGEG
jgi:predicted dehydrogenase